MLLSETYNNLFFCKFYKGHLLFQLFADILAAARDSPPSTKNGSSEDTATEYDSSRTDSCDTEDSTPESVTASTPKRSSKCFQVDIRPSTRTRRVQAVCASEQVAVQVTSAVRSTSVQCSLLTGPISDSSD